MRYTITRLCGGEALMLVPRDHIGMLNLVVLLESLSKDGIVARIDGLMLIMEWQGMEVTVYETGKLMFYPLKEKGEAIRHADRIIELFQGYLAIDD